MEIKLADKSNFTLSSLDAFQRFQTVTRVYRLTGEGLTPVYNPFTEDWSPERRREKAKEILSGRFITHLAFEDGRVVGEIMLVPEPDNGRLIIDSFHVSGECRRRGIGRALLSAAENTAREKGAKALYASACSAEETINFYLAMGFAPADNPIPAYAEDEPCDIQMEKPLT